MALHQNVTRYEHITSICDVLYLQVYSYEVVVITVSDGQTLLLSLSLYLLT